MECREAGCAGPPGAALSVPGPIPSFRGQGGNGEGRELSSREGDFVQYLKELPLKYLLVLPPKALEKNLLEMCANG